MFRKAVTVTTAVTRWLAAGSPVRPAEEVERIYREVCTPCPFFAANPRNRDGGVCAACGCYLKKKIAMATERCPHPQGAKWGGEVAPPGATS